MGERKKLLWKLAVILPVVLILAFLCMPREKGNTEGAIFRNIVRETLTLPVSVEICHIEDIDLPEGRMRAVIFDNEKDLSEDWSGKQYRIHWYLMDEKGDYALYWGDEGDGGGWMCEGVYHFSNLRIHGVDHNYDLEYVTDPAVKEIVIRYEYQWLDEMGEGQEQTVYASVSTKDAPKLFCISDYVDMPFAPEETDDISCSIVLSALDGDGNVLSGAVTKEEIDLHNIYKVETY